MALGSGPKNKKDLNFELSLIPFIDILSVCICFLLMTVIWVQVGALSAAQSMGGQSQADTPKVQTIWTQLSESGKITVTFKDVPQAPKPITVQGLAELNTLLTKAKTRYPEMRTAIIMPEKKVAYANIIATMDSFKKHGLIDVGVSPL